VKHEAKYEEEMAKKEQNKREMSDKLNKDG
jgi:hypothetical protein